MLSPFCLSVYYYYYRKVYHGAAFSQGFKHPSGFAYVDQPEEPKRLPSHWGAWSPGESLTKRTGRSTREQQRSNRGGTNPQILQTFPCASSGSPQGSKHPSGSAHVDQLGKKNSGAGRRSQKNRKNRKNREKPTKNRKISIQPTSRTGKTGKKYPGPAGRRLVPGGYFPVFPIRLVGRIGYFPVLPGFFHVFPVFPVFFLLIRPAPVFFRPGRSTYAKPLGCLEPWGEPHEAHGKVCQVWGLVPPLLLLCCSPVAPLLLLCCSSVAPLLLPCCSPVAPLLLLCCSSVAPLLLPCCSACCSPVAPLVAPLLLACCSPRLILQQDPTDGVQWRQSSLVQIGRMAVPPGAEEEKIPGPAG